MQLPHTEQRAELGEPDWTSVVSAKFPPYMSPLAGTGLLDDTIISR